MFCECIWGRRGAPPTTPLHLFFLRPTSSAGTAHPHLKRLHLQLKRNHRKELVPKSKIIIPKICPHPYVEKTVQTKLQTLLGQTCNSEFFSLSSSKREEEERRCRYRASPTEVDHAHDPGSFANHESLRQRYGHWICNHRLDQTLVFRLENT